MPVQHFWPEAQHTLGELWLPKAKLPVPSQKPCIKLSCSIPKAWGRDIHPLSLPWPQKAPPQDTAGPLKKEFRGTFWQPPAPPPLHYQQAALEGSALPRQQPLSPQGWGLGQRDPEQGPSRRQRDTPWPRDPRCGHCGEHCSLPPRSFPAENSAGAAF